VSNQSSGVVNAAYDQPFYPLLGEGNCKRALAELQYKKSFCQTNPENLGKHSNFHVLKLNKVQPICDN